MQRKKHRKTPDQHWIHARPFEERTVIAAQRCGLSQIKKTAGIIKAGGLRIWISGDLNKVRLSPD
jgi:hypothetical protein